MNFHEEGVRFIEKLSPVARIPDASGALEAVEFERQWFPWATA